MTTRLTLIATAAWLALAAPLAAQETTVPADEPATDQTEAPADAASDPATGAETGAETGAATPDGTLDLGTPVDEAGNAEPQPGQPYVREEFGDWALRCLRAEEGQDDPCQLYQLLLDQDENPVSEVSIVPLPEGSEAAAGVVIVVPLETLLDQGITVSIDGSEARRYEFDFCNRAGCVARFGLSTDQINQFKRGSAGQVRIVPALAPDEQVVLDMSLAGFTNGFTAAIPLAPEQPQQ